MSRTRRMGWSFKRKNLKKRRILARSERVLKKIKNLNTLRIKSLSVS